MKISYLLSQTRMLLKPICGPTAQAEAEEIFEYLLNCSRTELYCQSNNIFPPHLECSLYKIIERRLREEPLQYILGRAFFYSRYFVVTPATLIPRPETETLIECVLEFEKKTDAFFADIATGCGCIAAILCEKMPQWKCIATDNSIEALKISRYNCPSSVKLVCANMFSAFKPQPVFDFIVSNPPYISENEMATLDRSVREFEPRTALNGGSDGLKFFYIFAKYARYWLKPKGCLYCEIGFNQASKIVPLFNRLGWKSIEVFKDLASKPRVIKCNTD